MRRVTLRSLWEHKRRMVSTVVAIVLGVSFMTGTFILSSTLDQAYDDLFADALDDVDVVVRGPFLFKDPLLVNHYDRVPIEVVDQLAEVPGVAEAEASVVLDGQTSVNRVIGDDGEALGGAGGGATTFENWIDSDVLNPYRLESGRAPEADDEIALNVAAVEEGGFELGDFVTAVGSTGPKDYTLVGAFRFGTAKSAAGGVNATFTLDEAQRLTGLTDLGQIERVYIDGEPDVAPEELLAAVQDVVPELDTVTGTVAVQELSANRTSGFGFLQTALNVFGAIALFVGIFVISNTFSILVVQRTRELALLRALGASRGQVLGSMLLEAAVVGSIAALLGLVGGYLLARGIGGALEMIGAELPTSTLVLEPVTLALSLAIGVSITLLAALVPALRATRVPPLAALRDVAVDRSNVSRFRIGAGLVAVVAGIWNISDAWRSGAHSRSIPFVGAGSGLMLVGALVIGPVLAGRTIRFIGGPLPRFTGVTGKLATENASRSPKRTSATASAVVIGVALVTFVTVFASSANKSVDDEINRALAGDIVVKAEVEGVTLPSGIPRSVAERMQEVPGVDLVAAAGVTIAELTYPDGESATHLVSSVDRRGFGTVVRANLTEGDIADFDDDGILIDKYIAEDHDIEIGDRVSITTSTGQISQVVQGIMFDRAVLGYLTLTRDRFLEANPDALDTQVGATLEPGADLDTVMAEMEEVLRDIPGLDVLDRDGLAGSFKAQITGLITVMYGLLMLSVVIALIGVANTLSLSINERVRELGLLRAIGMDKVSLRATIRWEACLICLLGTVVGASVGFAVSVAVMKSLTSLGLTSFAVPVLGIAAILVLGAALGTLASARPAKRAAAIPMMEAIASE